MAAEANIAGWVLVGLSVIFMMWLGIRAEARRAQLGTLETQESRMAKQVMDLQRTVDTLLAKLNDAQNEIEKLRTQLNRANARISELEMMYDIMPGQPPQRLTPKRKLLRPLLVICGPDPAIVGADLAVLDAIGIRYTRLADATMQDVADEIGRARDDKRLYRWLLISAHAGPEGVQLKDAIAPPDFWLRTLNGIEVIGLAACRGTNIADHLRDRADFVWYFRENVPTNAANKFVQKFFQRLNADETPEQAFIACLDAVPEVAAYADYRTR